MPGVSCCRKQYGKVQDEDEDLEVQGGPANIQLPEVSAGSLGGSPSREAVDEYSYRSSGFIRRVAPTMLSKCLLGVNSGKGALGGTPCSMRAWAICGSVQSKLFIDVSSHSPPLG